MRLFLAIDVPDDVRRTIAQAQERLRKMLRPPISWVPTENFHLSLKFLGEAPDPKLVELLPALQQVKSDPFDLELTRIAQLPSNGKARVVMVDVGQIPPQLQLLYETIEDTMQATGFQREGRAYHPHLTLARLKVPRFIARELSEIELKPLRFRVNEFRLMESQLKHDGAEYHVAGRFALGKG